MNKELKEFLLNESNVINVYFEDGNKYEILEYNVAKFINVEDVDVWWNEPDITTENIEMLMDIPFIYELNVEDEFTALLTIINDKKFIKFKRKQKIKKINARVLSGDIKII